MQFFDTTSKQGLCQDADFFVDSDTNKFPLVDKARSATEWVKKVASWIWKSTGDWEFDDSNYTTLPVATSDAVNLQQDISLPTTVFKVDRLEILDINGNYQLVQPIDKSQIDDQALSEFMETAGLPKFYDLVGNSIIFYPKISSSNVTLTAAIKLYLSRDIDPFVSTDTSKEPGFSEYFHRAVSIGMAFDYAVKKTMTDKIVALKRLLYGDPNVKDDIGLKGEIEQAYGSRHRDFKTRIRVKEERMV